MVRSLSAVVVMLLVGCGSATGADAGARAPAPDATRSTLEVSKTTALADRSDTITITVTVRDATGAPVPRPQVSVTASGRGTPVDASGSAGDDGVLTVSLRSNVAEVRTVSATVTGPTGEVVLDAKPVVTFLAGPLAGVRFSVQPTQGRVGVALSPAIELVAFDANDNPVSSSTVTVALRLVRTPGGVLAGGAARPIVDGGVTFEGLIIDRPQTGVALRAEASNGAATESMTFDVVP
ncbi:MAG: Ig-like domain-containing protein [Myxococcus sp.]|nr:Ig-like domain-containing protein [Myxococcus sp.]